MRAQHKRERALRKSELERTVGDYMDRQVNDYEDAFRVQKDLELDGANKKAQEDHDGVQACISAIFDPVWNRISYELGQLQRLFDDCAIIVGISGAGREPFDDISVVPIAPALECLRSLYQKLDIRHQRASEAVLERDRQFEEIEAGLFRAKGAIQEVERIRVHYVQVKRQTVLDHNQRRHKLAKLFESVFVEHASRSVMQNQKYMEVIMQAARGVSLHRCVMDKYKLRNSKHDQPIVIEEISKARMILIALARSNERLAQSLHAAAMLFNAADYEVCVANAKLSKADPKVFRELINAQTEQESKLTRDLEHRKRYIKGSMSNSTGEITKLSILLQHKSNSTVDRDSADEASLMGLAANERDEELRTALYEAINKNKEKAAVQI